MAKKLNIGLIGETAAALELMKKGYDVVNLNNIRNNYQNADLICINPNTGKSVMIQVKTGTSNNIMTGLISELDGTIPDLDKKIIGPWIFIRIDEETLSMDFYVLTKEEVQTLIITSNDWYVNQWNRQLKKKPLVGIEVSWLKGESEEASSPIAKKQHKKYDNPLGHDSLNNWDIIEQLIG